MERQIEAALNRISPARIEIDADMSRFEAAINSVNNLGSTPINVVPEVDRATFVQGVQNAILGAVVTIGVVPDLDGIDRAIRAHNVPDITVDVDADTDRVNRSLRGLGRALGSLGGIAGTTLRLGAMGIAAAGAAQGVAGLVAALAPAAGLLAAGPAVILGYQAALGGLKLALTGVGDAFSAGLTGDAKEFEKAIKDLSPAAQAAAREVRALKPGFEDLRNTVQDSFFKVFEGDITRTAKALQGPLTDGLSSIATNWGRAARNVLGYVQSTKGVSNIKSVLDASALSVEGLALGANKLTAGFLQAADVVAKEFGGELAGGISNITERFGEFLQTAAGDGRLVAWVDGAIGVLAQLGDIIGNITGAIGGLFDAASASGGGFLTNLQKITQGFEDFIKSAEGQEAFGNIFGTIAALAAQLGPILTTVISALGKIVESIGPLFEAIGPVVIDVVDTIADALLELMPAVKTVVTALLTGLDAIVASGALEAIGDAIGGLATALAPVLPVIGELIAALGTVLAPILDAVATALMPVVAALSDALLPVIRPLTDAFLTLVSALTPLVVMLGQTLGPIIEAFAPWVATLATTFAELAVQLTPLIEQLTNALIPVFLALAPAVQQIVTALIPLVSQIIDSLLPALPPLVDAFVGILNAVLPVIPVIADLVTNLAPLVGWLLQLLGPIVTFGAEVLKWTALEVVVPIIQGIIAVLEGLTKFIGDVLDGARQFALGVVAAFEFLKNDVPRIVGEMVASVGKWFSTLFSDATKWVSDLWSSVTNLFGQIRDTVVQASLQLVNDAIGYFRQLPGKASGALSNLASSVVARIREAASQFIRATLQLVNDAVKTIKTLPGKAVSALGNLGSLLVNVGKDMIRGLINGIKSMAGAVFGAVKDVAGGAVNGVKDFLGISSPSRVFKEIGVFIGQGFVAGLTASEASVKKTADELASLIVEAFKGKNTRRDDVIVQFVRENQRELETLVAQREALAGRIKQATEFALQTADQARQSFGIGKLFQDVNEELKKIRESGSNRALSGGGVVGNLTQRVQASANQIRRFTSQVEDLAKRGLNRNLISQIIGLGPEQGAELAAQLSKASNAQIKNLSNAQNALDAAAKKFGQNSADLLFDSGKNAAEGFLTGLKSQQKEIEQLMVNIAKGMQKAIKQALGIKSPSRVFRGIGEDTGLGLVNGLDAMVGRVLGSAESMAAAVENPFTSVAVRPVEALATPFGTSASTNPFAARSGAPAASGATVTNNFVINEVGDGEATAARVLNRMALEAALV